MLFSFCLKITVKLHLYGKYPDTRKLTRRGRPPHAHKSSYTYRQILSQEIKITRKFYRPSIHFQACQKLINTLLFVVLLICERAMKCHLFGKQQYSSTKKLDYWLWQTRARTFVRITGSAGSFGWRDTQRCRNTFLFRSLLAIANCECCEYAASRHLRSNVPLCSKSEFSRNIKSWILTILWTSYEWLNNHIFSLNWCIWDWFVLLRI